MIDDFDRQDVMDLHRLVQERYDTTSLEGYHLLLWGDLKTLFEPNEENEIWKNQQDYNLINWRLFDSCGVHVLMLNRRLEVDFESEMAFELFRFTRSQLQKSDVERETVHTATTGVSVVSAPVTTVGVAISTTELRTPPKTTATAFIDEDLTIAQTLIKMKEEKAKEKGVAIKDVEDSARPIRSITTLQPLLTIDLKDKGKGVLVEEEPEKPEKVKRRDQGLAQIESDAKLAQRLHEEELAEIHVDHELAVRLTHEEQEKYTIEERARLTQVKNRMITYLKHMGKYTHQQLKHNTFEEVSKLYERKKRWIDDFKPIDDDNQQQAESTKKRPRADSEEESSKK
ncbi:hypothetical protein Tco_1458368 [Tanacetum coccineum]